MNALDRLLTLQAENDAAAVRMLEARPRFLQLAGRHENGIAAFCRDNPAMVD